MHAIILAAGRGNRLAEFNPDGRPKCLLEFGGRSLLERQLDILFRLGVRHATLVLGYKAGLIVEHIATLSSRPEMALFYNPAFEKGSVLSLLAAHEMMTSGETVLVLDADVLFHPRIMQKLIESAHENCYLLDRDFAAGDEPVKIAIHAGEMVEFRKALPDGLEFDTLGESVGFFKFNGEIAAKISQACEDYNSEGLLGAPHEEALRDVLLAQPSAFACEDVSGLPWLEIDFPEDVERAIKEVLPAIQKDVADF
ncbi:MAG: phosphocholine cytidylyltransferase family protein [Gammaproteobacteria bacterium]|nr:phosphocholine cytidylyltransferase family protein [Gammaproteobacteria bacterium]NNK99909.1 phosphocholine cytidylyltransferase family protein [Xanthomonadales bacterium]